MRPKIKAFLVRVPGFVLAALAIFAASPGRAGIFDAVSGSEKLTAVSASSHNGYVRTRLPDGSFKPETIAFGDGGVLDGYLLGEYATDDPTLNELNLQNVAHMLAGPLASQNYITARDPNTTNLLVMVYWGRTVGGVHTRDGSTRDLLDYDNARLLGFDSEINIQRLIDPSTVFFGRSIWSGMLDNLHADVLSAIEVDRYYVILKAYDFQAAWKQKKLTLLWETRFSLSERRHDFHRDLPAMAQNAELYFGQDSYGLVMKPIPEGHVHVGEVTPVIDRSIGDEGTFDPKSGVVGEWRRSSPGPRLIVHVDPTGVSSFESPGQHVSVPATVATDSGEVTVKVPGWGIIIEGKLRGDRITGTIFQYNHRNSVTLTRVAPPSASAAGDQPPN